MDRNFDELATFGGKFIVEPLGTELSDDERRALEELRPAGIMFRARNFVRDVGYEEWLERYRRLVLDLRAVIGRDDLILSIDHEGGRVVRPPAPITRFPYPAKWSHRARDVGQAMGIELRSLAINLSFSPVADIHSNPANPIINQRAFGRTADEVIDGALAFMEGLTAENVAACAKHFPGHGDTLVDSHFALPVLPHDERALTERELLPFRALIGAGVSFVMTGHLMLPAIDAAHPATFSRALLTRILRDQLGFRGAVIADAMGMKAVIDALDRPETTVTALNAGLDLYCVAGDAVNLNSALKWADFMRSAVQKGDVAESTIIESLDRIERTTARLATHSVVSLPSTTLEAHAALATELDREKDWGHFRLSLPGFE